MKLIKSTSKSGLSIIFDDNKKVDLNKVTSDFYINVKELNFSRSYLKIDKMTELVKNEDFEFNSEYELYSKLDSIQLDVDRSKEYHRNHKCESTGTTVKSTGTLKTINEVMKYLDEEDVTVFQALVEKAQRKSKSSNLEEQIEKLKAQLEELGK